MKTVSGKVVTTKPISLSKAAKVLSNFVATETGASQAVSAYLVRASAAFNELAQVHKELRSSRKADKQGEQTLEDWGESEIVRKKHKKKRKMGEDVEEESESRLANEHDGKKRKIEEADAVDHGSLKKKTRRKRKIESDQ